MLGGIVTRMHWQDHAKWSCGPYLVQGPYVPHPCCISTIAVGLYSALLWQLNNYCSDYNLFYKNISQHMILYFACRCFGNRVCNICTGERAIAYLIHCLSCLLTLFNKINTDNQDLFYTLLARNICWDGGRVYIASFISLFSNLWVNLFLL